MAKTAERRERCERKEAAIRWRMERGRVDSSRENQRRETSEREMVAKREVDKAKLAVIQLSPTKWSLL